MNKPNNPVEVHFTFFLHKTRADADRYIRHAEEVLGGRIGHFALEMPLRTSPVQNALFDQKLDVHSLSAYKESLLAEMRQEPDSPSNRRIKNFWVPVLDYLEEKMAAGHTVQWLERMPPDKYREFHEYRAQGKKYGQSSVDNFLAGLAQRAIGDKWLELNRWHLAGDLRRSAVETNVTQAVRLSKDRRLPPVIIVGQGAGHSTHAYRLAPRLGKSKGVGTIVHGHSLWWRSGALFRISRLQDVRRKPLTREQSARALLAEILVQSGLSKLVKSRSDAVSRAADIASTVKKAEIISLSRAVGKIEDQHGKKRHILEWVRKERPAFFAPAP